MIQFVHDDNHNARTHLNNSKHSSIASSNLASLSGTQVCNDGEPRSNQVTVMARCWPTTCSKDRPGAQRMHSVSISQYWRRQNESPLKIRSPVSLEDESELCQLAHISGLSSYGSSSVHLAVGFVVVMKSMMMCQNQIHMSLFVAWHFMAYWG